MYRLAELVTVVVLAWPVCLLGAADRPVEVQQGERLDPADYGPGVIEDMKAVEARDLAAREAGVLPAPDDHRGRWAIPSRGATYYPHSGVHNLLNKWGDTRMGIGFAGPVHLRGAYFSGQGGKGAWTTGVRAIGYRQGEEVSRTEWFTKISAEPAWFQMDLKDIDRVVIEAAPVFEGGGWYALDDLSFTRQAGEGQEATETVVLDFEDCSYRQVLSGTSYAGLTWEIGPGSYVREEDALPAPQEPPRAEQDQGRPIQDDSAATSRSGEGAPPALGLSFQGVIRGDAGSSSYPPDTCGAVGPDHFVVAVNRVLAIYDKNNGGLLSSTTLGSFLPGCSGDPRILFDQHSNRWVVIVSDFSSRLYLAMSLTDDPEGNWFKTNFLASQGPDAGCFPDYPTLGVDENGVYTSSYMAGCGMTIFAIDKAPLIAATPYLGTVTAFRGLEMTGAIQPAHTYGTPGYELYVCRKRSGSLLIRGVLPPLTSPSLVTWGEITIPGNSEPSDVPALGSSVDLDSVGDRLMNAVFRDDRLWTAHCIAYGDRTAARWYEIDTDSMDLVQYGTVSHPTRYYFFPTIAVNSRGDVAMGFSGAHGGQYAAAYYTGRLAVNAPADMAEPVRLRVGEAPQNNIDSYGRNRWGDYSLCTLDPTDELTLWTIQEYAHSENIWGTWIGQLLFPVDCNENGTDDYEDLAGGTSADCDGSGIPDECESGSGIVQTFDGAGGAFYQLNGSAEVISNAARLTPATASQIGSLVFEQRPFKQVASFTASFDFRIGGGTGADGFSFAILDSTRYSTAAQFGEQGPGGNSLVLQFDTYANSGENNNHLDLIFNGVSLGTYNPTFDLNNNQWHSAWVSFDGQSVTVELTPNGGSAETAYDSVAVSGYSPVTTLFGFGARTGGSTDEHWVDNITVSAVTVADCNGNGTLDECDIAAGTSSDCQSNDVPDDCELVDNDCNTNAVPDECDIAGATSTDCDWNNTPDECDLAAGTAEDCQPNGILDACEVLGNDCNYNDVPDDCDIAGATSEDCQPNGTPDECETGEDCNTNGVLDECDITHATSADYNTNGIPDECENIEVESVSSCRTHGPAGELCIGLGIGSGFRATGDNVDPRSGGMTKMVFALNLPVSNMQASVVCQYRGYSGTATPTANGTPTLAVSFDPALPYNDCCTISLTGDLEADYAVAILPGDADRNLDVNSLDYSSVKLRLGQPLDDSNACYDVNADGDITSLDYSAIKLNLGASLPGCP